MPYKFHFIGQADHEGLYLEHPFDERVVRDSECLVYYQGKIERFFLFLYLYCKEAMRGSELGVFQIPNNQAVEKVPVPSLP